MLADAEQSAKTGLDRVKRKAAGMVARARSEADDPRATASREAEEIDRHRDECAAQFAHLTSVLEGGPTAKESYSGGSGRAR